MAGVTKPLRWMSNSMVEQGVVTRLTDPADRRRVVLRLSEKGSELFQMADDQLVERFEVYLTQLPEKDRDDLNKASTLMLEVMERLVTYSHHLKKWGLLVRVA